MNRFREQLLLILTASFLVAAVASPEPTTLLLAGIAVAASSAVLGARYLAVLIVSLVARIASPQHRRQTEPDAQPAPSHPDTAGRRRSRAPSQVVVAT